MVLKFNVDACMKALFEKIIQLADALIDEMYADSTQGMTDGEKASVDVEYAKYAEGRIKSQIIYGALAIMKSYGTGSKMDKDNPALEAYMNSSKWNPLRSKTTLEIVGRSAGEDGKYENIFDKPGEKSGWTSGKLAGLNVEHIVQPREPTNVIKKMEEKYGINSIARMEQRYIGNQYTKVDSEFQRVVKEFLENEMHKFFYNTGG